MVWWARNHLTYANEVMSLLGYSELLRQSSGRLGYLMTTNPHEGQTDHLKQTLIGIEQAGQPLEKVINHPLQRYNGRTPVHLAASNGLWECLEILLKNGGSPNSISSQPDLCQTPLHLAATKGYAKCLQVLLEYGARMDIENSHRVTPLDLVRGKRQCEKVFQHAIAKVQIPSRTREQQQRVEKLHQLVEDGESLIEFYQLYETLPADHMDLATRWTDWYQQTLLYRAVAVDSFDIVQFMLSKSENQPLHNLNSEETALHVACKKSFHRLAQLLLKHSPKLLFCVNCQARLSPLHVACSRGDVEMVALILSHLRNLDQDPEFCGKNLLSLDFRDCLGRTPLFNACYYGYELIVRRLIEFHAEFKHCMSLNVNACVADTLRTPLHVAVRKNCTEIVKLLLSTRDIDINAEARPSGKTHKHLIRSLQKILHGRVIPQESIDEGPSIALPDSPFYPEDRTVTPTSTHSMLTMVSSGAIDETLGKFSHSPRIKTPEPHSSTMSFPSNPRSPSDRKAFTLQQQRSKAQLVAAKKRSSTDAVTLDDTRIAVFENRYGRLEVLNKDQQGNNLKSFDQLFMTPLAEACAWGHEEIVRLLLSHGAQDDSGLACRISHLLHNFHLQQLILAHHCMLVEKRREPRKPFEPRSMVLQLNWSDKKIPSVNEEWFGEGTMFYPPGKNAEDKATDTGYESRSEQPSPPHYRPVPSLTMVDFTNVRVVHLDRNQLESVPLRLFCLPNVTKINLAHNKITRLPEEDPRDGIPFEKLKFCGWECFELEDLDLRHNFLTKVPSCVWVLPSITKILANNNHLETLLPDRGRTVREEMLSQKLDLIDFSHNQLKVLPRFVFDFPSLRRVILQYNALETLPDTLWNCITLQELIVNNNQLTSLPWCEPEETMIDSRAEAGPSNLIRQCERALTGKVEVRPGFDRNNSFFKRQQSVTLQGIKPLASLQGLAWNNSSVAGSEGCDYSSLYKLNLAQNKLKHFPEALPCLAPNLGELDVSNNTFQSIDIKFIPQTIKKFTAKRCNIEMFGIVLRKNLHTQVVKNCRHGKTFGLPCQHRSHPRLPTLTTLSLPGNKLQHFQLIHHPPLNEDSTDDPSSWEAKFLSHISSLDLLYPALEGLDLTSNNLQGQFNPNIGHQSHLKWIWLKRNHDLQKIPMEFAYLKGTRQFTELGMEELPNLMEPPKEYQSVSLTHLLVYMRSRLKESVFYRTIKLFFIGSGMRGKTTLLRRLRSLPDKETDRTTGIDIEDWIYPEARKFSFKQPKHPVHFVAWDFAGQSVYHTTHQCFYSRRSLYLALFRLTDDKAGVSELDPWLRNVQLRAPGCPVIIVATHLDGVSETKAKELERAALSKYADTSIYPRVVNVVSVSSTRRATVFSANNMEKLRTLIYDVACHLQLATDGVTLEYKPDMSETDPKALFQQQIPKSFLDLQDTIRETVAECHMKRAPIMEEEEFRKSFKHHFEDEDELNEAVFCLNLQGTLLHFEDYGLRNVYFLDPQWLAKLMAEVIHPSAEKEGSPIRNGVAEVSQLFMQQEIPEKLKQKYIQLLEKFEVALKIDSFHVIIPSLMPDSAPYPKTNDILSDVTASYPHNFDSYYQPPFRRFWFSNYIPDGFWPRLICRIATDQHIGKVLRTIIGEDSNPSSSSPSSSMEKQSSGHHRETLHWIPWKTGIAFSHRGRTLLVVKQASNKALVESDRVHQVYLLEGEIRVEVHVYTPEWVALANELLDCDKMSYSLDNPFCLPGMATRLLVMISQHVKSLASDWFPGMFITPQSQKFPTYMPCWKCYAEIGSTKLQEGGPLSGVYIYKDQNPVYCFNFEDSIIPAAREEDLDCSIHGKIKVLHIAPDLVFWDLNNSYEDCTVPLKICEDEVLGKGGYGFVCKGQLVPENGPNKNVAVKVFLSDIEGLLDQSTIAELLDLSKQPKHLLYSYREIRQEVAFLSTLEHANLTQLCGVRTNPYMCLLLELAPKKSLRAMLKEYRDADVVLEPLTLKNTTMQISSALEYLHKHQVVHLDMKSPNILVWYFPAPNLSRQSRVRQAGNVWIKLADYGISQVSTGFTLRVGNSPVGTPGFMAPELFDRARQDVSSEKVDVFAFGMTLYELLSYRAPFDNVIPAVKRNHEVRDKQRPILKAKETRSLVVLQDLMMMCWAHEPDERPSMKQVNEWASAPEFERLRSEINLRDVHSTSCVCVCRVCPENEDDEDTTVNIGHIQQDEVFFTLEESMDSPYMHDLVVTNGFGPEPLGSGSMPSLLERNILPSVSEDDGHIEHSEGHFPVIAGKSSVVENDADGEVQLDPEPYTQIWICGRDQRKGLLQIFTYYDGQAGSYAFSGYCSKEEVSAMCPVRNTMWMGTSTGLLKVFHAPTLKAKFAGKLDIGNGTTASPILDILHVEETSSVLVVNTIGEIWSFSDKIVPGGLKIQDRILLPDNNPCFHLAKVNVQGSVEVWGTMDNNRVLLLERAELGWKKLEFESDPKDPKLRLCSFIAHANFTARDGKPANHIWISYRQRTFLVSWDAKERKQRAIVNCTNKLKTDDDVKFQVSTLVACGRKVLIGTTNGTVGILDSETCDVIQTLSWHNGKVRALLVMPKEMEPCICAEIPLPKKEEKESPGAMVNHTSRRTQQHPVPAPRQAPFSFMSNPMFISNQDPEAVMVTTIGNGRRRFIVNEPTKEERLEVFDNAARSIMSHRVKHSQYRTGEDICLLTWRT